MTIVQLVNPAPFGGLETVVTHLARGLRESGVSSAAVVLVDEGSPEPRLASDLMAAGVPVETLIVPPRRYLKERALILKTLRHLDARVVHSHGYRMDVMMRTVLATSRARWVSTLHGFIGGRRKNRTYEAMQLWALRRADRVIGVSRTVAARAASSGIDQSRIRLVQNAVPPAYLNSRAEAQAELGLDPSRRWVGWVGRLGAEKDPTLFARAIGAADDPTVAGVIVGGGPLLESLRSEYWDLIQGVLILAGPRSEAGRLMAAFDALVVSSVTEGTPMVVLEAMQSGVPVVAMAVGGLPDVLDGGAGILVTERSGIALGEAILHAVNDRLAASAVVEEAKRRIASHFSTPAWLSIHIQLYSELTSMHASAS